jgi:hypothetical protein
MLPTFTASSLGAFENSHRSDGLLKIIITLPGANLKTNRPKSLLLAENRPQGIRAYMSSAAFCPQNSACGKRHALAVAFREMRGHARKWHPAAWFFRRRPDRHSSVADLIRYPYRDWLRSRHPIGLHGRPRGKCAIDLLEEQLNIRTELSF